MYETDDELGPEARETATECPDCTVEPLDPVSGTAVRYELCTRHHRALYRRYVRRERPETPLARVSTPTLRRFYRGAPPPEDIGPAQFEEAVATLRSDPDDEEAARTMAAAIAGDPARADGHAVTDVCVGILREREDERWNRPYWCGRDALSRLVGQDPGVALEVAPLLSDDERRVRREAAGTLELMAVRHPDAVLGAGAGDRPATDGKPGPVVDALSEALADRESSIAATAATAVGELARRRPGAGRPAVGPLGDLLDDERAAGAAALALGRVGFGSPSAVGEYAPAVDSVRTDEGVSEVGRRRATLALAYLPGVSESSTVGPSDPLREVRRLADPAEFTEPGAREAVHALGRLGDRTDLDRLEWIRDACFDADLEVEARVAIDRIEERVG